MVHEAHTVVRADERANIYAVLDAVTDKLAPVNCAWTESRP